MSAALAGVAGFVDAYAFLNHESFASFMSGNTTKTGANAGAGMFSAAGKAFLPIPFYFLGAFTGTLMLSSALRRRQASLLAVVGIIIAGTMVGVLALNAPFWIVVPVLAFSMGMLSGRQAERRSWLRHWNAAHCSPPRRAGPSPVKNSRVCRGIRYQWLAHAASPCGVGELLDRSRARRGAGRYLQRMVAPAAAGRCCCRGDPGHRATELTQAPRRSDVRKVAGVDDALGTFRTSNWKIRDWRTRNGTGLCSQRRKLCRSTLPP